MVRGELISLRGDQKIPIRYESEGIKKIICILPIFIGAFSDPSMTIAVDELDAGIFEYLLGEILRVFQDYGKGQLLFTSHNMRPLELLNQQFIIFTTINPENRYIQIKRIKRSNNLRDVYYRDIQLGGEKETLYQETSRNALAFALEEAEEDG
jgi:AAA15 family ATPase/GTPase